MVVLIRGSWGPVWAWLMRLTTYYLLLTTYYLLLTTHYLLLTTATYYCSLLLLLLLVPSTRLLLLYLPTHRPTYLSYLPRGAPPPPLPLDPLWTQLLLQYWGPLLPAK